MGSSTPLPEGLAEVEKCLKSFMGPYHAVCAHEGCKQRRNAESALASLRAHAEQARRLVEDVVGYYGDALDPEAIDWGNTQIDFDGLLKLVEFAAAFPAPSPETEEKNDAES